MTDSKSERITALQALAEQERIAHPEDDEAAISAALDLIEERVKARRIAQRRSRMALLAAVLIGALAAALALWPHRRGGKERGRSA